MSTRDVQFREDAKIEMCPKCGNKTRFTIVSQQVAEDCCEVFARCACGFDHGTDHAFEDVWGGCHDDNVRAAISCWNSATVEHIARFFGEAALQAAAQQHKAGGE